MVEKTGGGQLKILIGAIIFAFGVVLILRHIHIWRKLTDATKDETERRFLLTQLRRRCLSSSGVIVLGLIFASFEWARESKEPYVMTILLGSALAIMCLTIVLALLDIIASRHILVREKQMSHEAKLELLREHQRLKKKLKETESNENSGN